MAPKSRDLNKSFPYLLFLMFFMFTVQLLLTAFEFVNLIAFFVA
jgi:hypothetical protein